jgi:hypothetical protein
MLEVLEVDRVRAPVGQNRPEPIVHVGAGHRVERSPAHSGRSLAAGVRQVERLHVTQSRDGRLRVRRLVRAARRGDGHVVAPSGQRRR